MIVNDEIPSRHYRNSLRALRDKIARQRDTTSRSFEDILNDVEHELDVILSAAPREDGSTTKVYGGRDAMVERIVDATAMVTSVPASLIRGRRRTKTVSLARHIAAYLICRRTTMTYCEAGRSLGGLDHSSVLYAKKRVESMRFSNEFGTRDVIEHIESLLDASTEAA